jgi:hypothetical protein
MSGSGLGTSHIWLGRVTNVALNNTSTPTYAFAIWSSRSTGSLSLILCILPFAHPLKPILDKKQIEKDGAVDGAVM